ncbi:MAG: hypothetical protein RL582_1388 [Bacteroidota bacterium]|jgi:predicted MPP superfamily phosphohydrolase
MKTPTGAILFLTFLFLLDLYVFSSVKHLSNGMSEKGKWWINAIYWSVSILTIAAFLLFITTNRQDLNHKVRTHLFAFIIGLFLAKLIAVLFFLLDDGRRIMQWAWVQGKSKLTDAPVSEDAISRSTFMSWLGVTVGFGLFGTLLYGFGNKYKFRVIHQKLKFSNLPKAFHGLRIVHISDIHCGSFFEQKAIEDGVKMINDQKADLILFTGDIVNNLADELEPHASIFARLKSPMGVYSVLGNHDYGDYVRWPEGGSEKKENLERLMALQKNMGWKLLMNEHEILEKDGDKIAIIGIENWGAKVGFKQYGKLHEAYPGTEQIPFKILMSHDPSHWKSQVKKDYPDIDLTLSGHTHGMQFGVEVPGLKWSPIQYVYKEWAGLYEEDNMKLYVNRGFGFLGYPGRVGVLPEITVIELMG